ncbi:MAG: FISUMP domain-containing protein [Sulfurimonas sp.]|jgi:uncharacterized protein (TIGR02145 family)|uniref:FISUMP domain-containing protein n=1 Tax=Sulfurimonas sp. TaxID=2022749 RepID=UPI00356727F7
MDACLYPKKDLFIRINLQCPYAGYYLRWYYNGWHYWHFRPGQQNIITEGENYRTLGKKKITLGTGNINYQQVTAIRSLLLTNEIQVYTESGWVNVFIDPSSLVVYDNKINGFEVELSITIGSKEISYFSYSPVEYIPIVPPSEDTDICEIVIGSQIWMCKNYDAVIPGSKVYNNIEANRDIYGGLYTWDQVMTPGFCPPGWKVPTEAEWNILLNYLSGSAVAGGHLKEIGTDHWDAPNTGADNSSGFAARGAGYWNYLFNSFAQLKKEATFWTQTEKSATNAATARLIFDDEYVGMYSSYKGYGFSVRLLKTEILYADWFLPSKDELNQMYINLHLEGLGGFSNFSYWSSSEFIFAIAWSQNFTDGTQNSDEDKSGTLKVRACRSFTGEIGEYSLRDTGPAGGFIFYISGTTYYEAAPEDLSNSAWSNIHDIAIGTTGTAIGTGKQNTLDIIAQAGHMDSAAKLCNDLEIYV